MSEINIYEAMSPAFWDLYDDIKAERHAEYWLDGGRGSTKSSFISLVIVRGLLADTDANAIIYRRVGNTIKDSVYSQMLWAIDRLELAPWFTARVSPFELIYRPTGQRILFRGADDPMKSKSIKLSRGYFKYLWYEELAEFRGMEDIRSIKQSVLRGVDRACTLYSYNPPRSAQNWVNVEALNPSERRMKHHSTYLDVPPEWLGDAFIAEAEALKRANERAYRNEYMGEVTGSGGQVFDNLELRPIPAEEIDGLERFYNGLDFGFAVDPDSFTRWGYSRRARRLYALGEYYGSRTPLDVLAERVSAQAGRELVQCDSEDPRTIAELRVRGVNAIGVKKGPGSVRHGMRWLQDLGAIVIDPVRTPNIAREFSKYEFDRDRNGNFLCEYPDRDNHCLTGDTLVRTSGGDFRIDSLVGKTGVVICYDEEAQRAARARFFDVRMTGVEEIIEIELTDGRKLRASAEHPILTRHGWVPAGALTDGDEIVEVADACAGRFVRVKSIRRTKPEPVYNMEVERYHNFAVNGGLIVHNCIDSARYALNPEIARRMAETRKDF